MTVRRIVRAAGVLVAVGGLAGSLLASSGPARADSPRTSLIIEYTVVATCPVYPNYPKSGVTMNDPWTITPSDIVGWRYNVSADPNTTYAMVSDRKYRNTSHPWWGFVKRTCIGTSTGTDANGNQQYFPTLNDPYPAGQPVPQRQLQGRSQYPENGYYRDVDFSPAAGTQSGNAHIYSNGTLRDYPNRFVIGNVFTNQVVHPTTQHSDGWTFVYAPDAERWGWVEDIHLNP